MEFKQRELQRFADPGDHRDPSEPGLILRISKSGTKTWYFVYRMGGRDARKQWLKIARFGDLPLVRAKELADAYRVKVQQGTDPAESIREARTRGTTIAQLADRFTTEYLPKRSESTREGYAGALKKYVLPAFGRIEVAKLTRDQVATWHRGIAQPIAANRALATLSAMLTQAIEVWDIRPGPNPCRKVERNPEQPRLRDIKTEELEAIGDAMRGLQGEGNLYALAAIRLVLLTAGRVSEVLSLQRGRDVDLDEGVALIRDHKGKKHGPKRMELPPAAVAILRELPKGKGNPYYIPGQKKGSHLTRDGLHKVWVQVCEKAGIEDLRLHDARSWAASQAESLGINPKTASAILGHRDVHTIMKHYTKVRSAQEAAAAVAAPMAKALGISESQPSE